MPSDGEKRYVVTFEIGVDAMEPPNLLDLTSFVYRCLELDGSAYKDDQPWRVAFVEPEPGKPYEIEQPFRDDQMTRHDV